MPAQSRLPPAAAEPAPATASAPQSGGVSAPAGYVLSPNDQVAVEVFGEDDLRTNGRLNGEGNLSLPLLGSVRLSGLTLTQAAARLTELYAKDYLVSPKVNVTLVGYAKRRFTILGQVNRPGSFEMPDGSPGGIDLLEAIAMAGGYTRIAAPGRISVRRQTQWQRSKSCKWMLGKSRKAGARSKSVPATRSPSEKAFSRWRRHQPRGDFLLLTRLAILL